MVVVQQLLWSPHYPKSVVVPDAVHVATRKPFKLPLRRTFIHSTFAFNITHFFAAAAAL
jgi:hypothetical protein